MAILDFELTQIKIPPNGSVQSRYLWKSYYMCKLQNLLDLIFTLFCIMTYADCRFIFNIPCGNMWIEI